MFFSAFSDHCFFDFGPILKCHTQAWKELIRFSDAELYAKSFEKKKKKGFIEARQTLKILGVAISNHIISFQFLPIFGRLKKTKIVWSSAEELAVTGEKSFFIISKEKIFRAD